MLFYDKVTKSDEHHSNKYRLIAQNSNIEYIDLIANSPNKSLLQKSQYKFYINNLVMPWQKSDNITYIATTNIDDEVTNWANKQYGIGNYQFIISARYNILWKLQEAINSYLDNHARFNLDNLHPELSAKIVLTTMQAIFIGISILLLTFNLIYMPLIGMIIIASISNIIYFCNSFYKAILFFIGMFNKNNDILQDVELPVYSILVPLYKEARAIKHIIGAIENIDYPSDKLDIKLVVEADDIETIAAIKNIKPDYHFEIIKVPTSLPRTKPKALNYALNFVRGEYIVIYDAEDKPESSQLKKALSKFKQLDAKCICLQARLNFYNRNKNILSGFFAIEYAHLFEYTLIGLDKLNMPIPLGGTSNHFKTNKLKEILAWDPYNVTEDADLGIRISTSGYYAKILDSETLEEAPITIKSWLKQRSRWFKGYFQTYLVHMRNPIKLLRNIGFKQFLGFQIFIGMQTLSYICLPFIMLSFIYLGIAENDDILYPKITNFIWITGIANIVINFIMHLIISIIITYRNSWSNMLKSTLLYPFYFIIHIIASYMALYQLCTNPHYWEKTEHFSEEVI
jgi:glycosyltransferase XagB